MISETDLTEKVHQLFISEDLGEHDRMFLQLETMRLIRAEQKEAYEQGRKDALEKVVLAIGAQILKLQEAQTHYKDGTPNYRCYSFIITEVHQTLNVVAEILSLSAKSKEQQEEGASEEK